MGIEDLKRWHWVAIGLVVGTLLTALRLWKPPGEGVVRGRTIGPQTLVASLGATDAANRPLIRGLTIYPPRKAGNTFYQYATGETLGPAVGGDGTYHHFGFHSAIPFRAREGAAPPTPTYSLRNFLEGAGADYRYAWWSTTPLTIALWGGGSVLLIGGVWPVVLGLLVGAGFGRRQVDEEEYDLDRFGGGATAPAPAAGADDRLSAIEAELLAALTTSPDHPDAADATRPVPPKALASEPVEPKDVGRPEREHHYRGQYYPVDLPGDRD